MNVRLGRMVANAEVIATVGVALHIYNICDGTRMRVIYNVRN